MKVDIFTQKNESRHLYLYTSRSNSLPGFYESPLQQKEITHPPGNVVFEIYPPAERGREKSMFRSGLFQDFLWFLSSLISLSLFLWICQKHFFLSALMGRFALVSIFTILVSIFIIFFLFFLFVSKFLSYIFFSFKSC